MKRLSVLLCLMLLLCGCSETQKEMDRAMALRTKLLGSQECTFTAEITADYGDKTYEFSLDCVGDTEGDLRFTVQRPDTIAGITGMISEENGALTFDDVVLYFEHLADGQVTPVSAPWILIHTLRGGYIIACTMEDNLLHLTIDDSYQEDALRLEVWLNEENVPVHTDIIWKNRRILSINIIDFRIL